MPARVGSRLRLEPFEEGTDRRALRRAPRVHEVEAAEVRDPVATERRAHQTLVQMLCEVRPFSDGETGAVHRRLDHLIVGREPQRARSIDRAQASRIEPLRPVVPGPAVQHGFEVETDVPRDIAGLLQAASGAPGERR